MISLSVVGICTCSSPDDSTLLTNLRIATVVQVNHDAPWEVYVKRLVCFLAGGMVALLVEMTLYPVRARDRLVESLVSSISQISIMESSVAEGIDSPNTIDTESQAPGAEFKNAKEKAEGALDAARTFLPFCLTEPRIKGNFKGQTLVYSEMIYVLFQIIERMDNMLHIRKLFGSGVLEELHQEILPYRRNVAGCVTLTLFVVQEALITKLPLPQFLPSSRVAQLRVVARVRELLLAREHQIETAPQQGPSTASDDKTPKFAAGQAYLAWRASSAGMMEIIEYLEELVDLAKLLVGVNAFRSGLLERAHFHEYSARMKALKSEAEKNREKTKGSKGGSKRHRLRKQLNVAQHVPPNSGLRRRQTAGASFAATGGDAAFDYTPLAEEDDISWSLQRVMTKRVEETRMMRRESEDPKGKRVLRNVHTWTG